MTEEMEISEPTVGQKFQGALIKLLANRAMEQAGKLIPGQGQPVPLGDEVIDGSDHLLAELSGCFDQLAAGVESIQQGQGVLANAIGAVNWKIGVETFGMNEDALPIIQRLEEVEKSPIGAMKKWADTAGEREKNANRREAELVQSIKELHRRWDAQVAELNTVISDLRDRLKNCNCTK